MLNEQIKKCTECPIAECKAKAWLTANYRPSNRQERYELAKLFVSSGLSVIPVPFGKKNPVIKWKEYQSRFANDSELKRWFLENDNTLGFVTGKISGLIVIDLDSDCAVEWAKHNLPYTPIKVKTNRGMHFYYTYPLINQAIRNKVKVTIDGLLMDLDVRAEGGFVMGIGAVHPKGCFYELVSN